MGKIKTRNLIIIIIIVGVIVVSLYIFFQFFSAELFTPGDTGRVAIQRARRELKSPMVSGGEVDRPFLKQHKVYLFRTNYPLSISFLSPHCEIVVGKADGKSFVLPRDFNKVISREEIEINTKEEALTIAKMYISHFVDWWDKPHVSVKIIYDISDIPYADRKSLPPQKRIMLGKNPAEFADLINAPEIIQKDEIYYVKFYIWYSCGGNLEERLFQIDKKGRVIEEKKVMIDFGIGKLEDCGSL